MAHHGHFRAMVLAWLLSCELGTDLRSVPARHMPREHRPRGPDVRQCYALVFHARIRPAPIGVGVASCRGALRNPGAPRCQQMVAEPRPNRSARRTGGLCGGMVCGGGRGGAMFRTGRRSRNLGAGEPGGPIAGVAPVPSLTTSISAADSNRPSQSRQHETVQQAAMPSGQTPQHAAAPLAHEEALTTTMATTVTGAPWLFELDAHAACQLDLLGPACKFIGSISQLRRTNSAAPCLTRARHAAPDLQMAMGLVRHAPRYMRSNVWCTQAPWAAAWMPP